MLVSHHHHGDNLDPTGIEMLPRLGTVLTTAKAAKKLAGSSHADRIHWIDPGESSTVAV